jgi:hypothetical protein
LETQLAAPVSFASNATRSAALFLRCSGIGQSNSSRP